MKPPLRELAWIITRDVNRTIGGLASMELLRRSFDARRWVDESTNHLLVAVSRLTPGTNILAYCVAAGWRLRGTRGVVTAIVAASLPSAILIYALALTLLRLDRYLVVRVLLGAGMLVAAGLVFSSAWYLLKPFLQSDRRVRATLIIVIAFGLYAWGWTPVRVLLVCAIVGALLPVQAAGAAAKPSGEATS
jgi:chromate transporter